MIAKLTVVALAAILGSVPIAYLAINLADKSPAALAAIGFGLAGVYLSRWRGSLKTMRYQRS